MRYLVTGGAGFIGSHLCEELVLDHEVVILDNFFSGNIVNIRHLLELSNVLLVKGSVTNYDLLLHCSKKCDGIFHQAAVTSVPRSVKNPIQTNEANVNGTVCTLMAAKENEIPAVIQASSSSVYGDTKQLPKHEQMNCNPKSPYAVSKLAAEYYANVFSDLYNLRTISLRYFNVFGPRQNPHSDYAAVIPKTIQRLKENKPPIIYGDGLQTRDFTYVKDVVQANINAMKSNANGQFNVAYNQRISINDLFLLIMDEMDIHIPPVYYPQRIGDVKDSQADISAAVSQFSYSPKYSVKSGIKETVKWFLNQ